MLLLRFDKGDGAGVKSGSRAWERLEGIRSRWRGRLLVVFCGHWLLL